MYDEIHIQGMWFNLPGYTFSFGCIIEFRETGGVYISPYYTLGQYVIVSTTDLSGWIYRDFKHTKRVRNCVCHSHYMVLDEAISWDNGLKAYKHVISILNERYNGCVGCNCFFNVQS